VAGNQKDSGIGQVLPQKMSRGETSRTRTSYHHISNYPHFK
jgi:hypothetical protein